MDASVIIVGAGVAGLSAAYELAKAGTKALVLEARQRIGGRIFTSRDNAGKPVELGAEFIHGKAPEFWELLERAHLPVKEMAERHQFCRDSKLTEDPGFWKVFGDIIKKIEQQKNEQSFATFLASLPDISTEWKKFATDFVEGFDAAHTERMSIHALAKEEKYSERIDGDHSFRITTGYDRLVEWLARELELKNIPVHCGTIVETVRWKRDGGVVIGTRDVQGSRTFEAEQAIITLPLGVLKAGDVRFEPDLTEKRRVIEGLDMGHVVKVNLKFRSRFWPEPNFGFIHSCDEWFPTWWSHDAPDLLTGWAGGPKAERMGEMQRDEIIARAVKALAGIFKVEKRKVNDALESAWFHDWSKDPFSRGAYSYITTGMVDAQQAFSEPVGRALYFAGEAATPEAQLGTVHGAIASGKRAARHILEIFPEQKPPRP